MKIVNSIRLPEALRASKTGSLWYAAAGMSIFKGLSGRLWTVSASPENVVDVVPTGLVLPRTIPVTRWTVPRAASSSSIRTMRLFTISTRGGS